MTAIPMRRGPRPRTTVETPHLQLDQQPTDPSLRRELAQRLFALPDVVEEPSGISVPGARALVLDEAAAAGPRHAFIVGREFAHLHPHPDESLHLALPADVADEAIEAGWAEHHPAAGSGPFGRGLVMVYAPRDAEELEVVAQLVRASWAYAAGRTATTVPPTDRHDESRI